MRGQLKDGLEWLGRRRTVVAVVASLYAVFKLAKWPLVWAWSLFDVEGVTTVTSYAGDHASLVAGVLAGAGAVVFLVVRWSLGWAARSSARSDESASDEQAGVRGTPAG